MAESKVPHFSSMEEFRAYVGKGFKAGGDSVAAAGHSEKKKESSHNGVVSVPSRISARELRSMHRSAQTRREVALTKAVIEGIEEADRIVTNSKVSQALANAQTTKRAHSIREKSLSRKHDEESKGSRLSSMLSPSSSFSSRSESASDLRVQRMVQVRNQERLMAAKTARQNRGILNKKRTEMTQGQQFAFEKRRAKRKVDLQEQYQQALASIGAAQKQAMELQSGLRTSAKEQLHAWQATNMNHEQLHRSAVQKELKTETIFQRTEKQALVRNRARVDQSSKQREDAHRSAAIQQAAAALVETENLRRVNLDYERLGMDRRVESTVYDHGGGGSTEFTSTRVRHRVLRHQRPNNFPHVRGEKPRPLDGSNIGTTTKQIPFIKREMQGNRPRDGRGGAQARRIEAHQEAKERARAAKMRVERAKQRNRSAAGKLRMEKEYATITKQLEKMEREARKKNAEKYGKSISKRNALSNNNRGRGRDPSQDSSLLIEDNFERMFVDGGLTSVDLSGVMHVADSQDAGGFDDIVQGRQAMWPRPKNNNDDADFFARGEFVVINDMQSERKSQEERRQKARLEQKRLLQEARLRASKREQAAQAQRNMLVAQSRNTEGVELSQAQRDLRNLQTSSQPPPPPTIVVPAAQLSKQENFDEEMDSNALQEEWASYIRDSPKVNEAAIADYVLEDGTHPKGQDFRDESNSVDVKPYINASREKIHSTGFGIFGEGTAKGTTTHVDRHSQVTTSLNNRRPGSGEHARHKRRFTMILQQIQAEGKGPLNKLPVLSAGSASTRGAEVEKDYPKLETEGGSDVEQDAEDLLEISENLNRLADELQRASAESPKRPSRTILSKDSNATEWYEVETNLVSNGDEEAAASAVAVHHQLHEQDMGPSQSIGEEDSAISNMQHRRESLKTLAHEAKSHVLNRRSTSQKDQHMMSELGLLPGDLSPPQDQKNLGGGTSEGIDNLLSDPSETQRQNDSKNAVIERTLNDSLDNITHVSPSYLSKAEPPKGPRDMGTYVVSVCTEEQQSRLGVNETGDQVDSAQSTKKEADFVEEEVIVAPPAALSAEKMPAPLSVPKSLSSNDKEIIENLVDGKSTDDSNAASKKLQALAARSRARQERLSKRRAERKAAAVGGGTVSSPRTTISAKKSSLKGVEASSSKRASPYAATQKAVIGGKSSINKSAAKRRKGPPAHLIARLSRKTSIPKGASAYGSIQEVSGRENTDADTKSMSGVKKTRRKKRPLTQEERIRMKRKAARERREKMKEEDKVSFYRATL